MATTFSRYIRRMEADSFARLALALVLTTTLLGAWTAWFFFARVALYEVSDTARIEVTRSVHPVESPVTGKVVRTRLVLGAAVETGDVLVELDDSAPRLRLQEERARQQSFSAELEELRRRAQTEEEGIDQAQEASRAALKEAQALYAEAMLTAGFAQEEAERLAKLVAEGQVARVELLRAQAEADKRRAAAEAHRLGVSRLEWQQRAIRNDRRARLNVIEGERVRIEGQVRASASAVEALQYEVERHRICAPVSGSLGQVAAVRLGSMVQVGDKLAEVVPSGELRVVAEFPPHAVGRVKEGQPARVRLQAFPWAQYGTISATVAKVASEPRDGKVRVELAIQPNPDSRIPNQHGLQGSVEVEVQRLSPAGILLRASGQLLARGSPPSEPASEPQ